MRHLFSQCLLLPFLLMPLLISGQQTGAPPPVKSATAQSFNELRSSSDADSAWKEAVRKKLNLMGHRNWILVVDKAFPEQSSPGMTYMYVEQALIPTLEEVLDLVAAGGHVRPVVYRDLELNYLSDKEVPGIEKFREESGQLFAGQSIQFLLHEEVFGLLDQSASLFTTLVIKTSCRMPYTSVFLQLDCAYWGPEEENALRERMRQSGE